MPTIAGLELSFTSPRGKGGVQAGRTKLTATDDALQGDEFRRTRRPYETIKIVEPIFTEELESAIQQLLVRYESGVGWIPPAYRFTSPENPKRWKTNKRARLKPILWVLGELPSADTQKEAINQVACVIQKVEEIAHQRFQDVAHLYLPDPLPMRLPEPLPETAGGQKLLVSYGTRHVTLFKTDGGIQVQCTPREAQKLDYVRRANTPGIELLTKLGDSSSAFWAMP
jgi:hypothetical protein